VLFDSNYITHLTLKDKRVVLEAGMTVLTWLKRYGALLTEGEEHVIEQARVRLDKAILLVAVLAGSEHPMT
jgi:hypothetical protein